MSSSNAPRPRPRILPAALLLALALALFGAGCATTPEARWAADRSRLTATTEVLSDLAEAGRLPPAALPAIDRTLKAVRRHLAAAAERLPEGGADFDHYLDAARAALDELWDIYVRNPDGPRNADPAGATGRPTTRPGQAGD